MKTILWKYLRYSICQLPIYGEFYSDFRLRETQNPRVLTEGGVENERLALFWGFSASGLLRLAVSSLRLKLQTAAARSWVRKRTRDSRLAMSCLRRGA